LASAHAVTAVAQIRHRVDAADGGGRADPDAQMQVRSCRLALGAHQGDALPGLDALADGDVALVHVPVLGHGAVFVQDSDPLPVAAGRAGGDDLAGADGVDGRAQGVGDVDAVVAAAVALADDAGGGAGRGERRRGGRRGGGRRGGGRGRAGRQGQEHGGCRDESGERMQTHGTSSPVMRCGDGPEAIRAEPHGGTRNVPE
jgi:hypothetical protein